MNKNLPFCACECGGRVSKPGNKFIYGHTWIGRHHSAETCEKQKESANKRWEDPLEHEKASISNKKAQGTPKARKANSKRGLKHYAEMDDPSQEIIKHHYIYDFNDLSKYTIPVTRSEHSTIHLNLRYAGLEVPCINIMKNNRKLIG